MMSLFSSFDLLYFYKNSLCFYLLSFSLSTKMYFFSSSSLLLEFIIKNLSNFFYSLKTKSFNKVSSLFFLSIFFFFLSLNFFSVFSYNFPLASQVSVVLMFSLSSWIMLILFGLSKTINKFLYHFIPEGTPMPLTFLLFLIEVVSNLIRPLTLMVRLVANILAGHLLMILLSQMVFLVPLFFPLYGVLNAVEIFVSMIQSYIFSTMLVLYFSEN